MKEFKERLQQVQEQQKQLAKEYQRPAPGVPVR